MAKQLTSGALEFVNKALGLFGKGAQATFLQDGTVQQVLEIANVAAYSQAIGSAQGYVQSTLNTTHAAAGDIVEIMDPYNPGTRTAAFAAVEIRDFDLWFLGAAARLMSTTQTVDEATVLISGTGMNNIHEGNATNINLMLARFLGATAADLGLGVFLLEPVSLKGFVPPPFGPFMWPRGQDLLVASQTTGAGATDINFSILWAMVNRGLKPSVT